jgi:hypothetical protein
MGKKNLPFLFKISLNNILGKPFLFTVAIDGIKVIWNFRTSVSVSELQTQFWIIVSGA